MKEQLTYKNKNVFVGIDVHKKSYKICVVMDGEIVARVTMLAEAEVLARYLRRFAEASGIYTVYEAGFSGFYLHRYLEGKGIKNLVVNPGSIAVEKNNRVKTDKRDAQRLALDLSQGRYRCIRIPSEAEELRRLLTRERARLVRLRTAVRNGVWMKLYQFGIIGPRQNRLSYSCVKEFTKKDGLGEELRKVLNNFLAQWEFLNAQIREMEKQIFASVKGSKIVEIYKSIPGIGETTACVLANELGDMKQFSSEKKANGFIGFAPSEDSSGEKVRRGHISRLGRATLRATLIQSAWIAIRNDEGLKKIYKRISSHAGGKRAIVAIAKKLIAIARALLREGRLYEPREVVAAEVGA